MIADNLKNSVKYVSCHEGFDKAFAFLEKAVSENLPVGRYEIDGDKVFAFIQEYESKLDSSFEAHKNYIDIQFILSGTEVMKVADISQMTVSVPYTEDVMFFEDNERASVLVIEEGEYGILFPWDAHKPGLCFDGKPAQVKKAVVKVKY